MPTDAARYTVARRAFGAPRFYAAYRAWPAHGDAVFHDLFVPASPRGMDPRGWPRRDPCAPASVSASRAGRGDGVSRGLPPRGGPQVGPALQGRLGPPRLSPHSPHDDVRPLSGAEWRVAPSGCRRGRSLDHAPDGRRHRAARCAARKARAETPERAGATPPPAPLRGPGSDPGGGRSCPRVPDHRPPKDLKRATRFPLPFRCAARAGTARPSD